MLSNAVKFTEHGRVSLDVECIDGETIVISVTDTGVGITAEEMRRLFQPFSQAESTRTTRKYGGTGLVCVCVCGCSVSLCLSLCVCLSGGVGVL